ncbi:MAG TPA: isoprenylcysteine carboxylmethyltransferase family protein [Candidatus Acidoferrales bacterium]|nr:isoprenylcysteine carboxylmethyltransferase family protein [Candidatus Acidoferrales bacterium]
MTFVDWIAAVVLFLQLPIPLYWFVLHPAKNFWSTRRKLVYIAALALSWLPITVLLFVYHGELLRRDRLSIWQFVLGIMLIGLEVWMFWRVKRDLGAARLIGATELAGGGQIEENGIYSRIRHPRYIGSFLALIGACLLAATPSMWIVAGIWTILTSIVIAMEERELRGRFGESYEEYCRRVPRFIPRLSLQRQK